MLPVVEVGDGDERLDPPTRSTTKSLRDQVLRPVEYPLYALLGGAVIVLGFSRVLLSISKDAAVIVFIIFGAASCSGRSSAR